MARKSAVRIEYEKQVKRIKQFISRAEKRGYRFIEDVVPQTPKRVTKQAVQRLKEITLYNIENKLEEIIKQAKAVGITLEEGLEIFKSIYEEV